MWITVIMQMTAIKHNANASLRIHCTYIANCQRTSLLIGAMRQTSTTAAMREPSSGRGLLMWERLAMASHCNCPLVQSNIKYLPLPVQHCCACINYAKWSWNSNCTFARIAPIASHQIRQTAIACTSTSTSQNWHVLASNFNAIPAPIRLHCLVHYRWNSLNVAIRRGFAGAGLRAVAIVTHVTEE